MTTILKHLRSHDNWMIFGGVIFCLSLVGAGIYATVQDANEAESISDTLRDTYGITVTDNEAVRIQFGYQVEVTGADGEPLHLILVDTNDKDADPTFTVGTPLEK